MTFSCVPVWLGYVTVLSTKRIAALKFFDGCMLCAIEYVCVLSTISHTIYTSCTSYTKYTGYQLVPLYLLYQDLYLSNAIPVLSLIGYPVYQWYTVRLLPVIPSIRNYTSDTTCTSFMPRLKAYMLIHKCFPRGIRHF